MTLTSEYARTMFGQAIGLMTGPEPFEERVVAACVHVTVLDGQYVFESEGLREDFGWLMSKRAELQGRDRMKVKTTDAELDTVREKILRIYRQLGG